MLWEGATNIKLYGVRDGTRCAMGDEPIVQLRLQRFSRC